MSALDSFYSSAHKIDNDSETFPNSDAWQVTITNPRGFTYNTKFYMGKGHEGKAPATLDVLNCLVSDANSVAGRSLEEFADELGYEIRSIADAKQCKKVYKKCRKIARELQNFLTREEWEAAENY
jgi:hypothetical protein